MKIATQRETTGAANWLSLAAAPSFALMALLTAVQGPSAADMLCAAAHEGSLLGGMAPMYLLMSAFHLVPWLRLVSGMRSRRGSLTADASPRASASARCSLAP
jgi:hypothetical protein